MAFELFVGQPGGSRLKLASGHALILDATHNAQGAHELNENLRQLCRRVGHKPIVLVGILGKERAEILLPMLVEHAAEIIVLVPNQPRACSFEEVIDCIPDSFDGIVRAGYLEVLFPKPEYCSLQLGVQLVATGSIYLMGEILQRIGQGVASTDMLQDYF